MNKNALIHKTRVLVPPFIRRIIKRKINVPEYVKYEREINNPFFNDPDEVLFEESKYTIGIFRDFYQYHKSYIKACRSLKVSYKLLNLYDPNWQKNVLESGCDAFLIWPDVGNTIWKEMTDDKIRILSEDLNLCVFPSVKEIWLYENKNRLQDWNRAHNLPQPKTWLFYEMIEALNFASECKLPIICKSNIGATARGVKVFRDRSKLKRFIKKTFKKGFTINGYHPLDKQWGRIYLQEFLEDVEEWRMIRIGDSYFGYRKEKTGDFHSGSGKWSWLDPGTELLDFLKKVTDIGNFKSMDVDVFKDKNGNFFINELQALFGASHPKEMLVIDGVEGRYIYENNKWVFEAGAFSENECSNLRVEYLLSLLEKKDTQVKLKTK